MSKLLHIFMLLSILIVNFVDTESFLRRLSSSHCKYSSNLEMNIGRHGENFKYMPTYRSNGEEYYPRTLHVAGTYPGVTPEEIAAVSSSSVPQFGSWSYDFIDPDGPQLGTVALPGSDVLYNAVDPIALITRNTDLGISVVEEVEVLLVVDRAIKTHDTDNFFLYLTNDNQLDILISDEVIPDYTILGQVVLVFIPFTATMKPKRTGFLEEDEE